MSPETIASIGIVSIFTLYTCIIYYAKYRDSKIWNNGICKKCGNSWTPISKKPPIFMCRCRTFQLMIRRFE